MANPEEQARMVAAVQQAVLAAASPATPADARREATHLLNQVKTGEARLAVGIATALVAAGNPLEVQLFGYQLLQLLVGVRWEEFSPAEHMGLASFAFQLLQQGAKGGEGWPLRGKAALLLALVAKRQGPDMWNEMLPSLTTAAQTGTVAAEMVCMVARFMSEEVTQFGDDLSADARRVLLLGLTASLDTVLPLLKNLTEMHFGLALASNQQGDADGAKPHAAVVTAALAAIASYTEWVPVSRLGSTGLLTACCYLVSVPDYSIASLSILRSLSSRKKGDDSAAITPLMEAAGDALMRTSAEVLAPAVAPQLNYDCSLEELGQQLVETLAIFGQNHFFCLSGQEKRLLFLQQMLGFMEYPYMLLAGKTHPFWTFILKSCAKAGSPVPQDCITAVLDRAGEQLRTGAHLVEEAAIPPYFDDFDEYKRAAIEFRGGLMDIIRSAALLLPEEAIAAAARRMAACVAVCSSSTTPPEEQQTQLESGIYFMESVITAWTPNPKAASGAVQPIWPPPAGLQAGMRGILQGLLTARMCPDAALLALHARSLEAFGKFLDIAPDLAQQVMNKVFDMFTYVQLEGDPRAAPPGDPPPGWKDKFSARQRVAQVLVSIARASPQVLVPHLSEQAARIKSMSAAGILWRGESNVLSDALIAASVAGSPDLQAQVVEWVLSPVREEWIRPDWQHHLESPEAFIQRFMPLTARPLGAIEVGGGLPRWALYHDLHLVERAAKRLPASARLGAAFEGPSDPSYHTLNPHLAWLAGPLLQIVICLHSVWSPESRAALQAVSSALDIGPKEKALYLKKSLKGAPAQAGEPDNTTLSGDLPASLRSWLRQVRELLYQACGVFCSQVGGWYGNPTARALWPTALVGSLHIMENWQLRLLIRHTVITLVRACPAAQRADWLLAVLAPLMPHLRQRLATAWQSFLGTRGAAAAGAGEASMEDARAADAEVIAERQLRELTQETMYMLEAIKGEVKGSDENLLEWMMQFARDTLHATAGLAMDALLWPDDSLYRAAMFCRSLVPLAARDVSLQEAVNHAMLQASFAALAYDSGNVLKAEVLHLARDIILTTVPIPPGPRQELLRLPKVDEDTLAQFETAAKATGSEKEQQKLVKKLLQNSGVEQLQFALADAVFSKGGIPRLSEPKPPVRRHARVDEQGGSFGIPSEAPALLA